MNGKKVAAIGLGLGLMFLSVTGCSAGDGGKHQSVQQEQPAKVEPPPPPFFQEKFQIDSDGRTVRCFYKEINGGYGYGNAAAMSCDWATAVVHK